MKITAKWNHRLNFTGKADSGFALPLDADHIVGGDEEGFRPMELIVLGLAGCTAMDVISILRKKRQDVTDFEVQVQAERAQDHPRVFTDIQIHFIVSGHDIEEAAVKRAIELSETKYCPAYAMLAKAVPIGSSFTINQAH